MVAAPSKRQGRDSTEEVSNSNSTCRNNSAETISQEIDDEGRGLFSNGPELTRCVCRFANWILVCKKTANTGDDRWWLVMTIAGDDWCNEIFGWQWMMRQMEQSQFGGCRGIASWMVGGYNAGWWTWTATVFAEQSPGENPPGNNKNVRCLWELVVDGGWCFFLGFKLIKKVGPGKYSLSLPGQLFCWVVVSNIFYVHPENWGNDPIWSYYLRE